MLTICIKGRELWDEVKEEFLQIEGCELILEHSLVSISKWEAKYHKPFLSSDKTVEETLDYIQMMNIGKKPKNPFVYHLLSKEQVEQIDKYIHDPMTATVFSKEEENEANKDSSRDKFVTSEEIYYWMTAQNIPFECQYWHLNRLITLIKICAIENKPKDKKQKKMTSTDLMARRARMDAARKKYGG